MSFIQSERSWLVPTLIVVLVGIALILAGTLLNRSPLRRPTTTTAVGASAETSDTTTLTNFETVSDEPTIASASSFDPPPGDSTEQDDRLSYTFDGDDETFWRTETYLRENFGDLKDGVGIIISFAGPSLLNDLEIDSPTDGWSANIYVSDAIAPTLDGWGESIGRVENGKRVDLSRPQWRDR